MVCVLRKLWTQISVELIIATLCTSAYMIFQIRQDVIYHFVCMAHVSEANESCSKNSNLNDSIKAEIESQAAHYIYLCNVIESVLPAILSLIIGPWIDVHGRW